MGTYRFSWEALGTWGTGGTREALQGQSMLTSVPPWPTAPCLAPGSQSSCRIE